MKKYALIPYCLLFVQLAFAQNVLYEIKGAVNGVMDSIPLESATVYLQNTKDNSLITYTTSDRKGAFILSGKTTHKNANLFISYVGSKTYTKTIAIKAKTDLKRIYLENSSMLDAVTITSRLPVIIKQDTLEFDPNAFKTKKEASVEDFIKKLPGAEVDAQGNIAINGKVVNKILVNGKPFFSNDPTIATQNLTKDIIEKLQVTDTKTNSEAFTGEAGNGDYKTINLVIKEEHNKGAFGNLAAGIGDNDRYEFSGIYNKFNNDKNISFLSNGNNINAPRINFGTKGITVSKKAGMTYADEIAKNHFLGINYVYADRLFENKLIASTEYIVPEAPYVLNAVSTSKTESSRHGLDLEHQVKISATCHLDVIATYNYSSTESLYNSDSETFDAFNTLTNSSTTNSNNTEKAKEFTNAIDFTKKLGTKGAFVKLKLGYGIHHLEGDDFLVSEISFFNSSTADIFRNQFTDTNEKENSITTRLLFRLPIITQKVFVDFEYDIYKRQQESHKIVFDFNQDQQAYTLFNTPLSSDFTYKNKTETPRVKLNYKNKKLRVFVNFNYAFKTLENQDKLRPDLDIKRDFGIFTYESGIYYKLSNRTLINSGISLANAIPSLSQLQSFTNVSDPLNIIRGNPNLRPQNKYSIYLNFRTNNFKKGFGFYSLLKADLERNTVASKYTITDNLIRETTYLNVNGNYGYHSFFNLYKNIKLDALRKIRIKLDGAISTTKRVNFNNDTQYHVRTTNYGPSFGFDFEWENTFDFNMDYNWNYIKSNYSIDGFEDEEIITHQLNFYTETQILENLRWENKMRYIYNPNVSDNFDKHAWSWNTSLTYSFMKEKLNLSLKMYNVLDQNINTRRIVTTDYIKNSQNLALQRFIMLTLGWRFNSFKKK